MKHLWIVLIAITTLISCTKDDNEGCGPHAVINNDLYEDTVTDTYQVQNAYINRNCLIVNLGATGCDGRTWSAQLIQAEEIIQNPELPRTLRIELTTSEDCDAYIFKTFRFDISNLVMDRDVASFDLEGWDEVLIYE